MTVQKTKAQGCSDAGFCTMGAMKPDQHFNRRVQLKLRSVQIAQYVGETVFGEINTATIVDLQVGIDEKNSVQFKLPYVITTGDLGTNSGLGDISVSYTHTIYNHKDYQWQATIGGKLPTGDATRTNDEGFVFPMVYQTTLGSYDLVGGLSFVSRRWLLATGIQHPLNANDNTFTRTTWEGSSLEEVARKYPAANQLLRGTDIMLRIERNFRLSRFNFHIGLLPIYRINKDQIVDPATQTRIKVDKTTGLALSGLAGFGYNFNTRSGIKGLFGARIEDRDVNPDGLYREVVATLGYVLRF
ncbi:MAG: hypothetical protein ACFB0B_04675 [Thermonemataceae bacterium]